MLPQGLQHHLEQVLQLIGLALGPVGVDERRGHGVEGAGGLLAEGLPLAAAAAGARHLRCVQAVSHAGEVVGRERQGRSGVWSRGRGGGGRGTPVQSRARRGLHGESSADPIALVAGLSVWGGERGEHRR